MILGRGEGRYGGGEAATGGILLRGTRRCDSQDFTPNSHKFSRPAGASSGKVEIPRILGICEQATLPPLSRSPLPPCPPFALSASLSLRSTPAARSAFAALGAWWRLAAHSLAAGPACPWACAWAWATPTACGATEPGQRRGERRHGEKRATSVQEAT